MSLLIRFCKGVASGPLPKSPLMSLLTYQFPNLYRVPFNGFGGNLFSDGTCNCVGQCVYVIVNFVLSNGHFVKCGLCHS